MYMNTTDQTLTISDLNSIKSVIETACNRGAFRADEMKAVGTVYEKLSSFLTVVAVQAQAQAQVDPEADNQQSQGDPQ